MLKYVYKFQKKKKKKKENGFNYYYFSSFMVHSQKPLNTFPLSAHIPLRFKNCV